MKCNRLIKTVLCLSYVCSTHIAESAITHPIDTLNATVLPYEKHDTSLKISYNIVQIAKKDSVVHSKFRNFLDTLKNKGKFTSTLLSPVVVGNNSSEKSKTNNENLYDKFEGLTIDSIFFNSTKPFAEMDRKAFKGWLSRAGNNLTSTVKDRVIAKNLIFKVGDTISSSVMERNEFIIRQLPYVSDANFTIQTTENGSVNVTVNVKNKLPIYIGLTDASNDNDYILIEDTNIGGTGNTLFIRDRINISDIELTNGIDLGFNIANMWGSFIDLESFVGMGDNYEQIYTNLSKEFINPSDFAVGVEFNYLQDDKELEVSDSLMNITSRSGHVWGGKSFRLNKRDMSLYFTTKLEGYNYLKAPTTSEYLNPYFHDRVAILGAIGLYKEHFYKGNLIYGYGYTEDIPYGYKFELIGGYEWNEFRDMPYIGGSIAGGFKTSLGYYNFKIEAGSYINGIASLERAVTKGEFTFFTNLITLSNSYFFRGFLKGSYVNGFNMLYGEEQVCWFNGNQKIRGTSMDDISGRTRLFISPEVVLFTPWHFLDFRVAPFLYSDTGTLGGHADPFKNSCYSTIGIGVRIKNQSLVMPTIQLRVSLLLKGDKDINSSYYFLNREPNLSLGRYIADQPYIINYQ